MEPNPQPPQSIDEKILELANQILLDTLKDLKGQSLMELVTDTLADGSTVTKAVSRTLGISDIRAVAKDKHTQIRQTRQDQDFDSACSKLPLQTLTMGLDDLVEADFEDENFADRNPS